MISLDKINPAIIPYTTIFYRYPNGVTSTLLIGIPLRVSRFLEIKATDKFTIVDAGNPRKAWRDRKIIGVGTSLYFSIPAEFRHDYHITNQSIVKSLIKDKTIEIEACSRIQRNRFHGQLLKRHYGAGVITIPRDIRLVSGLNPTDSISYYINSSLAANVHRILMGTTIALYIPKIDDYSDRINKEDLLLFTMSEKRLYHDKTISFSEILRTE